MSSHGLSRYVGVGGIAQMDATRGGRWMLAVVRAVIKAATDHQGAYEHLVGTELDWVLAGCPQIVKGEPRPVHLEFGKVPGRRLVVTAGPVAKFLLEEVESDRFNCQIVGVWNS